MVVIRRLAQDIADVAKQEIDKERGSEFRIQALMRIQETIIELSTATHEALSKAWRDDYKEYVDEELTKRIRKGN